MAKIIEATTEAEFKAKKAKGAKIYQGKKISSKKHLEQMARKSSGEMKHSHRRRCYDYNVDDNDGYTVGLQR